MKLKLSKLKFLVLTSLLLQSNAYVFALELEFGTIDRGSLGRDVLTEKIIINSYKKIGIDVEISYLPGKRSLIHANRGVTDGELRRKGGVTKDYENLIKVPTPVAMLEICRFLLKENKEKLLNKELKELRAGASRGRRMSSTVVKEAKEHYVVNDSSQIFKLLESKRIDVGIGNCRVMKQYIEKNKLTQFEVIYPPIRKVSLYHYLHNKHKSLVPKIDKVFKEIN